MIVIADIHGRTHWKRDLAAVTGEGGSLREKVVFLGDYLDHYPSQKNGDEPITQESSVENFLEIIEFKKAHMDDVVLLLGNHDVEYIDRVCPSCRSYFESRSGQFSRIEFEKYRAMFMDSIGLFDIAHHEEMFGKTFIFSHATLNPGWVATQPFFGMEFGEVSEEDIARRLPEVVDFMNGALHSGDADKLSALMRALSAVSAYRGGWAQHASCVWEDFREHDGDSSPENIYQVVGHTQHMASDGMLMCKKDAVCLDCHIDETNNRKAFRIVPFRDNGDGNEVPVEVL